MVIAGCAHAGVVNTLARVCELTGRAEVLALAGGLHLGRATHEELEAAASAIGARNIRFLAPCHCTGINATSFLRTRFPGLAHEVGVGARLVFGER